MVSSRNALSMSLVFGRRGDLALALVAYAGDALSGEVLHLSTHVSQTFWCLLVLILPVLVSS